jgi:tetratricopeptide (TPR) repeat protein
LKQFEQSQADHFATDSQKASLFLQLGKLSSMLQRHQDAQEFYRKLVAIAPGGYVFMAASLTEEGKIEEALDLYFKAAESDKSASAGTALAQFLASTKYAGPRLATANKLLEDTLNSHGDNIPLLLSLGVLAVERGQTDLAVDFFRRVSKVEPGNSLALNNLATLLGESPQHRAEAIECIDRAIAVDGRKAALLDTRGTIYLLAGEYAQAIASLEEAVAGGSFDPRYDFHLAVAYQKANRLEDARRAISVAEGNGLGDAMLTANDEQLLNQLHQALAEASQN